MTLEASLQARLTGFAGLTALVGTRIYGGFRLPQNVTMPAVTWGRISLLPEHAMGEDSALEHDRVQVSSWAETYDEVRQVATQVRLALSRWSDPGPGTVIQDSLIQDGTGQDLFEEDVGEDGIWQRVLDFFVHGTGF